MPEIKYPYFKKNRILKIQMLEGIRDYPRDVLEAYNENLSDGIVCGLTPSVDKDVITFSKGIVKYKGQAYVFGEPVSINYSETEVDVLIKLSFQEEETDRDYKTQLVEIAIDRDLSIKENQVELGRFKLKKGAYLRSDYQDLYDFTTEYNTINVVQVLYSGYKQPTISNELLKYFARAVLETRTQNQMDITFSMLCLNSSRVERDVVLGFIGYKLDEEIKDMTNTGLHHKLVKILGNIKKENSGLKRKRADRHKIIMD